MNKHMIFTIFYVSTLITVAVLGIYYWGMQHYRGAPDFLDHIQTLAFTAIIVMELTRLQAIRSEYHLGILSNKYLVLAVGSSFFLQLIVLYTPLVKFFGTTPLSLLDWGVIVGASVAVYILSKVGAAVKKKFS